MKMLMPSPGGMLSGEVRVFVIEGRYLGSITKPYMVFLSQRGKAVC
jgi:hypothetical protein